jgi:pyrophosphatase PpaX
MRPRARALLFDLDGTLIDSIELIVRSYEHAVAAHGLPSPGRAEWLRGLGTPLKHQFAALLPDEAGRDAKVEELIRTYRAWNMAHHDELVRPYEGVRETLAELARQGRPMGVVTSKMRTSALRGLAHVGLEERWFSCLVALEDTERHKPHPEPVLRAVERLGLAAADVVYIGDSPHDAQSALSAGARAAPVRWGPFAEEHFAHLDAERLEWLDEPARILAL